MSFSLTELHLWSLKNTLHIGDRAIGIYQYYDKKDPPVSLTEHGNIEEKQKLAESRDYPWTLKNRRPEKLRDSLKELEELMQNSHCVLSKWKNKYVCRLLFGSGVLVSLSLSGPQLEKVVIDRSHFVSWLFPVVLLLSSTSSLVLIVHFESNLTLQKSSGVHLFGIVDVTQSHLSELLACKGMASRPMLFFSLGTEIYN
ncbi:WD repeat-containing and planar cell polarity effector protein fritz homolog [Vulpes lagopus]